MNKTSLRSTLIALEEAQLRQSRDAYASYLKDAARDPGEPVDQDQASQSFASAELAQYFEGPTRTYEAAIAKLKAIDLGPKSKVEEGAAVRVDGRWYVVAVATQTFQCDGKSCMGITIEAPIFAALEGARAGDVVEFRGHELTVQDVA